MDTKNKLLGMIDANLPIIYIQDYDFVRTDTLIDSVRLGENTRILEWNPAMGETQFSLGKEIPKKFFRKMMVGSGEAMSLEDFLRREVDREGDEENERFLVLRNVHEDLNDMKIVTLLQLLAQRRLEESPFNTTVFIVSSILNIPKELKEFISVFEIDFPDEDEIEKIIQEHARVNECEVREAVIEELMPSLKGLSCFQVDRMIDMVMSENGTFESKDKSMILQQKRIIVKKSGILDLVETPATLDDVGGLENLKDYLKKKQKIFSELEVAKSYGVSIPKGIFLVGMPGCGKSLCAKAAASLFGVPLLRLDMGRLQAKYVGESEANLRTAIKTAEAAAPCVLWIDEIEKGFATRNGENDIVMRMFATFLSWLQEKQSSVYVIATANNVDNLPPELKRKGRFDEIFCVNLPKASERQAIFKVHLRRFDNTKMSCKLSDSEIETLAKKTTGFNGADIESVVDLAAESVFLKDAVGEDKKITKSDVLSAIKATKSISTSCKGQIETMQKVFKTTGFVSASSLKDAADDI